MLGDRTAHSTAIDNPAKPAWNLQLNRRRPTPSRSRPFLMTQRKAIGIDLGTTFSAVAHIDPYGKPHIIPNSENERITPSVILFDGNTVVVGSVAKNSAVAEPEKIVDFVKREMGKPKEQFSREFDGKIYSAEELSALIGRKLKRDA